MKNQEELRKIIHELANKIASITDNGKILLAGRELYEKAILLNYVIQESNNTKVISNEIKQATTHTPSVDLFSNNNTETKTPEAKSQLSNLVEKNSSTSKDKNAKDIKSFIGINDKFQFINELFDGNMKEYAQAIDQINNFSSTKEIDDYVSNLKRDYNWDNDNVVVRNFEIIINKLF